MCKAPITIVVIIVAKEVSIAGNHPAFDGPSWRGAEGLFPPLRHEDGEQPDWGDQILAPGHHHVPGEDDGDGGDDGGLVQVHEQYAGQEEEWRHELRVGIKFKISLLDPSTSDIYGV